MDRSASSTSLDHLQATSIPAEARRIGYVTINGQQRPVYVLVTDDTGTAVDLQPNLEREAAAITELFRAVIEAHNPAANDTLNKANDEGLELTNSASRTYTKRHNNEDGSRAAWNAFRQGVLGQETPATARSYPAEPRSAPTSPTTYRQPPREDSMGARSLSGGLSPIHSHGSARSLSEEIVTTHYRGPERRRESAGFSANADGSRYAATTERRDSTSLLHPQTPVFSRQSSYSRPNDLERAPGMGAPLLATVQSTSADPLRRSKRSDTKRLRTPVNRFNVARPAPKQQQPTALALSLTPPPEGATPKRAARSLSPPQARREAQLAAPTITAAEESHLQAQRAARALEILQDSEKQGAELKDLGRSRGSSPRTSPRISPASVEVSEVSGVASGVAGTDVRDELLAKRKQHRVSPEVSVLTGLSTPAISVAE